MKLQSIVQQRGAVSFPAFLGERVYMREFHKGAGLPLDLARWQPTVDAMLEGVDADGPIYLMIDQSPVAAGVTQRRPGMHVDGYWIAAKGRHDPRPPEHRGRPYAAAWDTGPRWNDACDFAAPEAIILASDIPASRAMAGSFTGSPGEGGDCSGINTAGMREVILEAGTVYAGNVTMLHESLPVERDCLRTLVRLSVPGWSP